MSSNSTPPSHPTAPCSPSAAPIRVLGSSLGLWTRDADGSDPRPVEMPEEPAATPSPEPPRARAAAAGTAHLARRHRPRIRRRAGRISILDLEHKQPSTAPFAVLSAPTWLPDGSGILIAGLPGRAGDRANCPFGRCRSSTGCRCRSMPRSSRRCAWSACLAAPRRSRPLAFGPGSARPVVDADGRDAFIRLEGTDAEAGSLWLSSTVNDAGDEVRLDPGAPVGSASLPPSRRRWSSAGFPAPGDDRVGGVWLVDLQSGAAAALGRRLAAALAAVTVDPSRGRGLPYRRFAGGCADATHRRRFRVRHHATCNTGAP